MNQETLLLLRTDSKHQDFIKLVAALDLDLSISDGDQHDFYHQFNGIDGLKHTIVLYKNELPIGCGALKVFNGDTLEVKRMYVIPEFRGMGIATKILKELEEWTKELKYTYCILETGKKQPDAIALYKKNGYTIIDNYGQYKNVGNSVCFKKNVS